MARRSAERNRHVCSRFFTLTSSMSCCFLLCLCVFVHVSIETSFCSKHFPPGREQLQYTSISTNGHPVATRVKRRITSDNFQIDIHYDRSVKKYLCACSLLHFDRSTSVSCRLNKEEQKLIRDAVESATDYWSKAIRPKYKLNDRIRLTR